MGILRIVVISILSLSAVVFCALFGGLPRFRKTPIGYANRLIWIQIPSSFLTVDRWLTGGRSAVWLKNTGNYFMNSNHPFVLGFYLSLMVGGELTFIPAVWEFLTGSEQTLVLTAIVLPYIFTYLTVTSSASIITPENHHIEMHQYPYDHILYYPENFCRTCRHIKPARSKHCRVCNVCVAKMDHHCPWVMTCLGRDNYRWFLLMLATLGAMLAYGGRLGYRILFDYLQDKFDHENPKLDQVWTTGLTFSQKLNMFGWAFIWDTRIGACSMLAAFTAPLAWGLLLYHIYLIWAGVTTNESFKWDDWKEDVRDGYVFKSRVPGVLPENPQEPYVRWPKTSQQVLCNSAIRTSRERFPPNMNLREPEWSRVESMRDVDNIYDLGFLRNLQEVFSI